MEIYVVQPGDSVSKIAASTGISPNSVIFINQLVPPYALAVGQALLLVAQEELALLPSGSNSETKPVITAFGYAYPFITPWVLNQTLPFLTDLHIFSYGFTFDGRLLPPPLDDSWMINAARSAFVRPILTLTPLGPDGKFNNALISSMIQNEAYKQNLIQQLYETLVQKGYVGVDVDFEFILASDRDAFTDFVADLAAALRPSGYTVSVALAPKTSATQQGLVYAGKDYGGLGAAADSVLLMTYEWGYK